MPTYADYGGDDGFAFSYSRMIRLPVGFSKYEFESFRQKRDDVLPIFTQRPVDFYLYRLRTVSEILMDLRRLFRSSGKIFVSDLHGETAFGHKSGIPKILDSQGFSNVGDDRSSGGGILREKEDFGILLCGREAGFAKPHSHADVESHVSAVFESVNVDEHRHFAHFDRDVPGESHEVMHEIT